MSTNPQASYVLDKDELYRLRQLKLLRDLDYVFFALQIDFPGKLRPKINVTEFCKRWELNIGNFYKALGELKNKGIIIEIGDQIDLQMKKE